MTWSSASAFHGRTLPIANGSSAMRGEGRRGTVLSELIERGNHGRVSYTTTGREFDADLQADKSRLMVRGY